MELRCTALSVARKAEVGGVFSVEIPAGGVSFYVWKYFPLFHSIALKTHPSESTNQSNAADRLSRPAHKSILKPPSSHAVGIRKLHYNSDYWRIEEDYSRIFLRSEFY